MSGRISLLKNWRWPCRGKGSPRESQFLETAVSPSISYTVQGRGESARENPPCWRGSRTWSFRTRRSLRTQRCGQTCRLRRRQSPSCRSGARQSRATRGSPCSSPRSAAGTGPRAAGGLCALQEGSRANGVSGRLLKLQPRKLPQPTLELVDVFLLRERGVSALRSPRQPVYRDWRPRSSDLRGARKPPRAAASRSLVAVAL